MSFQFTELEQWEQEQQAKAEARLYPTKQSRGDPRTNVVLEYRRKNACFSRHKYLHECKYVRRLTQHRFRQLLKHELCNEAYYRPRPHDHKTYGWVTW